MTTPPRPFERVLAITDCFDHPRRGVAYFNGRPHGYELVLDVERDEYEVDLYDLRAVDGDTARLAKEFHEIWMHWQDALHAGRVSVDRKAALPEDRARHNELEQDLEARLAALTGPATRARAVFRRTDEPDHGRQAPDLEVQWTPSAPPPDRSGPTAARPEGVA